MSDHLPPHPVGYDKHDVNIPLVVVSTIVSILFVVVSAIVLDTYFIWTDESIKKKDAVVIDERLIRLREQEAAALTSYGTADTIGVHYRIPIAAAESLLIAERSTASAQQR